VTNPHNNDSANSLALLMAAGSLILFTFGLALIALAAFFTVLSFLAQFRPITLWGATITAKEGRQFVWGGVLGIIVLLGCVPSIATTMNQHPESFWPPFVIALSYSASALLIMWVRGVVDEQKKAAALAQPQALEPASLPTPSQAPPYKFADWQDAPR
jgi:hypothetical protein